MTGISKVRATSHQRDERRFSFEELTLNFVIREV